MNACRVIDCHSNLDRSIIKNCLHTTKLHLRTVAMRRQIIRTNRLACLHAKSNNGRRGSAIETRQITTNRGNAHVTKIKASGNISHLQLRIASPNDGTNTLLTTIHCTQPRREGLRALINRVVYNTRNISHNSGERDPDNKACSTTTPRAMLHQPRHNTRP